MPVEYAMKLIGWLPDIHAVNNNEEEDSIKNLIENEVDTYDHKGVAAKYDTVPELRKNSAKIVDTINYKGISCTLA